MIYEFSVGKRGAGKQSLNELRASGKIPGVIYGPEVKENILVACERNAFEKLYRQAGEASLINLAVEGEKAARETLIKEVSFEVVKGFPIHVDFYQVKKGHKITLEIPLRFTGESPAVKAFGAVLIKNMSGLAIKCLPKDLINEVFVDIGKLATLEDKIRVKDLNVPATVEVLADPEQIVALAAVQEEEKEAPKVEAAAATATEGATAGAAEVKTEPEKKEEKK